MDVQNRNNYLVTNIKEVQIKSVKGTLFPDFTKIYGTPSKIVPNIKDRLDKRGLAYDYKLELQYPGLKEVDFEQFREMKLDRFELLVIYTDGNKYTWSNKHFPFRLRTNFSKRTSLTFIRTSPIPAGITYSYAVPGYVINYFE